MYESHRAYAHIGRDPIVAQDLPGLGGRLSDPPTLFSRTSALVRGLILVLQHHNVHRSVQTALDSQVHAYLDSCADEAVWIKRSKDLLAYPLAQYLKNELPESPDVRFTPKGPLRGFFRSRMISNVDRKGIHFWYSWLQCKRCTLPVSIDMIELAYQKHFEVLTREDDGDEDLISDIMSNRTFIGYLDKIRSSLQRYYLSTDRSEVDFSASLSACFETTRSDGGAFGELYRCATGRDFLNPTDRLGFDELDSMTFCPKFLDGHVGKYDFVCETRRPSSVVEWDWADLKVRQPRDGSLFLSRSAMAAKIQGIVEPMKVRVISKGYAVEYYLCKKLQVGLHSALRDTKCMRLIGSPVFSTDLADIRKVPYSRDDGLELEWMSIDYSSATDNLSWRYSSRIMEYVLQDFTSMLPLAREVLGPHELYYPKKGSPGVYESTSRGRMRRGQLMGSILSFPFLCLANLGLYINVTRDYHFGWTDGEILSSCLVNGDDMLYLAPPSYFEAHVETGRKVGLEMTVGKAYHHKKFANVNSTSFFCGDTIDQVDFLNTGLFFGQHKVMNKEGKDGGKVVVINEILKGSCRSDRRADLLRSYLSTHAKEIRAEQFVMLPRGNYHYRNLFLPISNGGMGVECPDGFKYYVNRMDLSLADSMHRHFQENISECRPLPGRDAKLVMRNLTVPYENFRKDPDCSYLEVDPFLPRKGKSVFRRASRVRRPVIYWGVSVAA